MQSSVQHKIIKGIVTVQCGENTEVQKDKDHSSGIFFSYGPHLV